MSDKILMEDWRKFLVEEYSVDKGEWVDPAGGTSSATPKQDKPSVPLSLPTVKEYMHWIELANRAAGIESRWSVLGDLTIAQDKWVAGADAASQAINAMAADYAKANVAEKGKEAYRSNPFLIFMDIWDPYYDVVQEKIIEDFFKQLGQQLQDEDIGPNSEMPDIDQALERYIKKNYNGILLDGAPHAKDEWAQRATENIKKLKTQIFFGSGEERNKAEEMLSDLGHIGKGVLRSIEKMYKSADRLIRSLTLGRFGIEEFKEAFKEQAPSVAAGGLNPAQFVEYLTDNNLWKELGEDITRAQQREKKL